MPLEIIPHIACCSLSSVKPGSLVQYDDMLAISIAYRSEDSQSRVLATYSSDGYFIHREVHGEAQVLDFGNEIPLQIDMTQRATYEAPGYRSGMSLFLFDDGPCVVLRGRQMDWALAKLKTGIIPPYHGHLKPTFLNWRLGIRNSVGKPTWLIQWTHKAVPL